MAHSKGEDLQHPVLGLGEQFRRLSPVGAIAIFAASAAIVFVGLAIAQPGGQPEPRLVDAPERSSTSTTVMTVEARADGVYINGKKQASEQPPRSSGEPRPSGAPTEAKPAARLDRAIGQKIMSRMEGHTPSFALLRSIRKGRIGGVILFGDNIVTQRQIAAVVAQLQSAARAGGNPPLLVAVDQEGGDVKRFASLPPHAAAAAMGGGRDPAGSAAAEGAATGRALAELGINVDLAPVADVRSSAGNFLGSRAFGTSPGVVANAACGFARGLSQSSVIPTLKHFPGLGAASGNTDLRSVVISASPGQLRRAYEPYRRCADAQTLVMISSAIYPALTASQPAVLNREIYQQELAGTGFRGVTISDDLQAPAVDPIPDLAVKASAAGLDILLYAKSEAASALAYRQMKAAIRDGRLPARLVVDSAAQIRELKQSTAP